MPRRKARCSQGSVKSIKYAGTSMQRQRVTCPVCGESSTGVFLTEWRPTTCLKGHTWDRKTGEALTEKQKDRLLPDYAVWTPPRPQKVKIKLRRKRR